MVPTPSRRTLLQASGIALATGLAGCSLQYDPATETTTTRNRFGDDTDGNGSVDDSEGGSQGGTQNDNQGGSQGGNGGTGTQDGVVTYDIILRNEITASDLRPAPDVPADAPAKLSVRTEINYEDREREVIFERAVELEPGGTRTYEDAFTTEEPSVEYVVRAALTPYTDRENDRFVKSTHTEAERFTPGGFGGPKTDTFYVIPRDGERGNDFEPYLTMYTEDPATR